MAYGAWGHWGEYYARKHAVFQEASEKQVSDYKQHVKNGTVPKNSSIPYNFRAPKAFVFVPNLPPVYPEWARSKSSVQKTILKDFISKGRAVSINISHPIPDYNPYASIQTYVETFERARHLKPTQ